MFPTKDIYVTADFGVKGSWAAGYHTGVDYRAPVGTPIRASKGGRVEFAGYSGGWGEAYGNHVIIVSTHEGRTLKHMYAHLSAFRVRAGERVTNGQVIGLSGNTGNSSGPHLHYEERHSPYGYNDHHRPVLTVWQPRPVISLRKVKPGKTNKHVLRLKRRLNKQFPKRKKLIGPYFSKALQERYADYQKTLGYSNKDANGIPGRISLQKLGFRVRP